MIHAELASEVAVSRSLLDERFRQVLGRSPIRYLTEWRMHLAEELLATTDIGIFELVRRVGYDSEEAFQPCVQTGPRLAAESLASRPREHTGRELAAAGDRLIEDLPAELDER